MDYRTDWMDVWMDYFVIFPEALRFNIVTEQRFLTTSSNKNATCDAKHRHKIRPSEMLRFESIK